MNQPQLVIATNNPHKFEEFKALFSPIGFKVVSLNDLKIDVDIEENGTSYAENALIKAQAIRDLVDGWILADDSGIEIDALKGQLGIHSARYLGVETSFSEKNKHIIKEMENESNRNASFMCAIALVHPDQSYWITVNRCDGTIANTVNEPSGFGYDPIFIPLGYDVAFSQMTQQLKNEVSHRGKAARAAMEYLSIIMEGNDE